jgi:hypothetical protein
MIRSCLGVSEITSECDLLPHQFLSNGALQEGPGVAVRAGLADCRVIQITSSCAFGHATCFGIL